MNEINPSGLFDSEFTATGTTIISSKADEPAASPATASSTPATPVTSPSEVLMEVDLGDGSGKQVFKGKDYEEVAQKLAEAQKHATRKIRELNQKMKSSIQPKKREASTFQPKTLTADEEFLLGQQLSTNPRAAFEKLIESTFGAKPEAIAAKISRAEQLEEIVSGQQAAASFLADHKDDFNPTPANTAKIQSYLDSNGYAYTKENFEFAFQELNSSGLLEKPVVATPTPETRIETPPATPKATGLSDRASRPNDAAPASVPTVEELYAMPYEQRIETISRALYEQSRRK